MVVVIGDMAMCRWRSWWCGSGDRGGVVVAIVVAVAAVVVLVVMAMVVAVVVMVRWC
jgi:hypothetical protein